MADFFKEWRALIIIALIAALLRAALGIALKMTVTPHAETQKAARYKSAQRFDLPAQWRWSLWREWLDPWNDSYEILVGGDWYPSYLVQPSLK